MKWTKDWIITGVFWNIVKNKVNPLFPNVGTAQRFVVFWAIFIFWCLRRPALVSLFTLHVWIVGGAKPAAM